MNNKSIATRESLALMQNLAECRQENRTDNSTDPRVNAAEFALNELLAILVKRMEVSHN